MNYKCKIKGTNVICYFKRQGLVLKDFQISEEYAQFYGAMTMKNGMVTMPMRKDGLPYEEMGYSIGGPPNR